MKSRAIVLRKAQERVRQIMERLEKERISPPRKILFGWRYRCPKCGHRLRKEKVGFGSPGSPSILFFVLFECPCGYEYACPLYGWESPGGELKPKKVVLEKKILPNY